METSIGALKSYLANPPSLAEDPKSLLRRRPKKRRVRTPVGSDEEDNRPARRKKQAETQLFKSAAFIADSDDDEEADRAFFEMEKRLRAEMDNVAKQKGIGSLEEGLKKRKRDEVEKRKRALARVAKLIGSDEDSEIGEPDGQEPVAASPETRFAPADSDGEEEEEEEVLEKTPRRPAKKHTSAVRSSPVQSDADSDVNMERNSGDGPEADDEEEQDEDEDEDAADDEDDNASVGSIPVIRRRQMSASKSPSPAAARAGPASEEPAGSEEELEASPAVTQRKSKTKRVVDSDEE